MKQSHSASISFWLIRLFFCGALAMALPAVPGPLAAQDRGAPPPAEQPAPAEPGRFGANLRELDADAIKALGLDQPRAILINYLTPEGPAESAGFKPGDVIVKVNGNPASSVNEFIQQIKQMGRGAELQLDIWRRGERMSLSARLGSAKEKAKEATPDQQIDAYQAILTIFGKDTFPILWAHAQDDLGFAYWSRITGNREENIEDAIKADEDALTVYTREANAEDWARVQNNLAQAYGYRTKGSGDENLEAAIKAYEAALSVWSREGFPQDWAIAQYNLGVAYVKRIRGDSKENIDAAKTALEAAFSVITRDTFPGGPESWARVQRDLGRIYVMRGHHGSDAENIESAIKACEAALTVFTRDAFPEDWALTKYDLGKAYESRTWGSQSDNVETAIGAYQAALTVWTRESFPREWANVQIDLGSAYRQRIRGTSAENIEAAIKASEAAMSVFTRDAFPEDWALAQDNLGQSYVRRIQGRGLENVEAAIKAFEAALTVYTPEAYPGDWAITKHNLGIAYSDRVLGNRAENIEAAIEAYKAVLTVWRREAFPQQWATIQNNLGVAYQDRIEGSRAENLEAAIEAFEAALAVYTRESYPYDWAELQTNLGRAYQGRILGRREENLEAAIKAYEAASTFIMRDTYPHYSLVLSRRLADIWIELGNWQNAQPALGSAKEVFFVLFGEGIDEEEARRLISLAGSQFADLAYAQARIGDTKTALATLSEGRALLLSAALRQQSLPFTPAEQTAYQSLRLEIKEWAKLAEAKGTEGADALQHLSAARSKFSALLKEASRRNQAETGIDAIVRQGFLKDSAVVAPIVTRWGSKILIVNAADGVPAISAADFPDLTTDKLQDLLRHAGEDGQTTGWLQDYDRQQTEPKAWLAAIREIGPKLWTLFAGKLDAALKQAGVKDGARLVVLPVGALGLLPLELARDPASGRSFGEAYNVTEVPSLEAYLAAARAAARSGEPSLAEAVNPTGDIPGLGLPYTEVEGALVASRFKGKPLVKLDRTSATPDVVLAGLKGKSYWHFASHGLFDWDDARQSGLMMKDRQILTVGALLDARGTLGAPRLVVLSACETGLYDANKNPDEFVGLPATFLQLGAAGVIGSLWEVDDLATALLMARFYDLHIEGGLAPSVALKQAKAWLRGATRRELIAYAKAALKPANVQPEVPDLVASLSTSRRGEATRFAGVWNALEEAGAERGKHAKRRQGKQPAASLDEKPFAHPYFWSGFVYTGY